MIVSTPQDLALRDAVRGVDLFKKVDVPILGMVQNMSTFVCTQCGHEHDIFGLDGPYLLSFGVPRMLMICRSKAQVRRNGHQAPWRHPAPPTDLQ